MDRKKSICHVTSVHPSADVRIFWKECLSLAQRYEVFLIAPNTEERCEQGIQIYNVNLPVGRFKRQRSLDHVFKKMMEVNADVYHFHDPELMKIGIKIKKYGKKIVFDSHEDVPMQILCKEYLPSWSKKPLSMIYSWYEKRLLQQYDALISVTPTIVERLSKINPCTYMVTNYPVLEENTDCSHNWGERYVCFAGGISRQYMHEYVIRALGKTSAKYLLAGKSYPGYIEDLQKLDGWKHVEYLGVVGHDHVFEIYRKSVAGVVLLDYTPNVGYHRGTLGVLKLFEYMMAGIPVIATDFELWKEIIEGNDCGICINPHDIDSIVNAINFFIGHPEKAKQMGENGRKAVQERYNWMSQERILFDVYSKLFEG